MKTITTTEFEREVLNSDIPVMVKFTAEWCGPCRILQPILEQAAKDLEGKAKIVKLDVDESSEIASKYRIKSIPTMIIFVNGEVAATQIGSAPKEKLIALFGDLV